MANQTTPKHIISDLCLKKYTFTQFVNIFHIKIKYVLFIKNHTAFSCFGLNFAMLMAKYIATEMRTSIAYLKYLSFK